MKHILFVCTGNTCRSPMCAALVNARYHGKDVIASSAGLYANGSPISRNAVNALSDMGVREMDCVPYAAHVSQTVTENDMAYADHVYGVTPAHAAQLKARFPAYASKVSALPLPISDPFGGDLDDYKRCLFDIDAALQLLDFTTGDGT